MLNARQVGQIAGRVKLAEAGGDYRVNDIDLEITDVAGNHVDNPYLDPAPLGNGEFAFEGWGGAVGESYRSGSRGTSTSRTTSPAATSSSS